MYGDFAYISSTNTGHLGKPVNVDVESLDGIDKERYYSGYRDHGFNVYASDLVGLQRKLPRVPIDE